MAPQPPVQWRAHDPVFGYPIDSQIPEPKAYQQLLGPPLVRAFSTSVF